MKIQSVILAEGIPGNLILWGIVLVVGLVLVIWAFSFLSIFIRALVSGAPVGIVDRKSVV